MDSVCHTRKIALCSLFLIFFLFVVSPCRALIVPPDPFESTDRFALLNLTPDGTITQVLVKVKAPGQNPLGAGELWAILRYRQPLPGNHKFHFAASKPVPIERLSNTAPVLIEFDFSAEPIPAGGYHRRLLVHYQEDSESIPQLISKYRPEQLLQGSIANTIQAYSSAKQTIPGSTLILGPIIFSREREKPKTERISFTPPDATGSFLLRLTNGTPEGSNRISSAVVKLNGKEVFRPSEFNQNVAELRRQVTLLSCENLLEVKLRSAPGSFIMLELLRLEKQTCQILDIHTFTRSKGKPVDEILVFELNPQFSGPFNLHLTNGTPDGYHRVDSAKIKLNGKLVFEPSDFDEQIKEVSQVVSLKSSNTLSVELRGTPGDFLTLEIAGYDNIPPSVIITDPSSGDIFHENPITVSGIVDDPSSSVTLNGILVPIASNGSFLAEGITLKEGENAIRVIATDTCGNQGEDQIKVYLKTVPEGPYLLFCPEPFYERRPDAPEEGCSQQIFEKHVGTVAGLMDETAVSLTLNGILLPDGVEVSGQGSIDYAIRDGNFFWAFVHIPQVEGIHPFTAVVSNADGGQTQATVYFVVDMVPPKVTITSPNDGLVTSTPVITITGTVDDTEASLRFGWYDSWIPVEDGTFTAQYTLVREGLNYVSVTARDPAENYSSFTLRIILDTKPPQINVNSPSEGEAVNTATLSITGSIIDENINEVTVSVNDGQLQILPLTGTNFSGVVNLNPGQNILVFHAVDKAGNTASVTHSALLDAQVPAVTITAPQTGVVVSGSITVAAEASDTASGITNVTFYIDGQAQTSLNQPPFNFTLDTSMLASGLHTITASALDRAGNKAEGSVSVTIDNLAPIVAITTPTPGTTLSGLVTVSVQASDAISEIAGVSLYLDGQLRGALSQAPFNFPLNTLSFASGSHTIIAKATDNAGNQSEASIVIFFDHEAPTVSITAPASGAMISGIITVSVEAGDSISGVASVTLYVDNQLHSRLDQSPFSFIVDASALDPGPHIFAAKAIDIAGNPGEGSITVTVMEGIRIEITSPNNGSTVNRSTVLIEGKIYNQTGEVGVNVNGCLAQVQEGDFAVIVPLQIGENNITATATRPDGIRGGASVTINTETQQESVRLIATPTTSILDQTGISNVTLKAEAYLGNPVSSYSWDFDGDGTAEVTGTETEITAQYQYPRLYFPRVTVTDNQGTSYTETSIVHILSREEINALLKSKWQAMKEALFNKHIPKSLGYFIESSREIYQQAFNLIIDELPQIVSDMQDIEIIFLFDNTAKYRINRVHNIEGVLQTITYYIYFVRDLDGLWRIDRF